MVNHNKSRMTKSVAGLAVLLLSGTAAFAQYGQYRQYGPPQEGYGSYYREQGNRPLLGARQGWIAGLAQGQSDREYGHSFRPTKVNTYKHVPDAPQGYPRDAFKNEYRDAVIKGYSHGYGRG